MPVERPGSLVLDDSPLVSVIVCTWNRPDWLPRAVESVLTQELPERDAIEVIIVDDGSEPPVTLPEAWRCRVRLVRTEHQGVGAARWTGLAEARGEFIAYCDDDDEWLPGHLAALLDELRKRPGADLAYVDAVWDGGAPPPPDKFGEAGVIHASDVLHRAAAARRAGGYDAHLPACEDADLWLRMSEAAHFRRVPRVLTMHGAPIERVSAQAHDDVFRRVYQHHLHNRLRRTRALSFRRKVAGGMGVAFDPSTWVPERRQLVWQSPLDPKQSFGWVSLILMQELERLGVEITLGPRRDDSSGAHARWRRPLESRLGTLGFVFDYMLGPLCLPCERVAQYRMCESTHVPQSIVREINQTSLLYVPCRQNVEVFRDYGVRVPIRVLHHGVHADAFPYLERERSGAEPFTFGTMGVIQPRKGVDVLVRAFRDEFRPDEPVRLLLKHTGAALRYDLGNDLDDPRIVLLTSYRTQAELLEILREMDVFVLPSRGEGFGLTALEAMATGLPLIATNWSGPVDYLDPADSYPLDYELVDARGIASAGVRFFDKWAEPSYEHLRALMRHLYEHRDEAAAKGRLASQRVHTAWTWERAARAMLADFDALAQGMSPG
jgi:glycosyltransferase involved in cell wall biosynthesis